MGIIRKVTMGIIRKGRRYYMAILGIVMFVTLFVCFVDLKKKYNAMSLHLGGTLERTGGFLESPAQSDGTRTIESSGGFLDSPTKSGGTTTMEYTGHLTTVTSQSVPPKAVDNGLSNKTWCLSTDPGFKDGEVRAGVTSGGQYCMNSNKTWTLNIDLNIERFYTFYSVPGHGNPAIRTHQVVADKSHRAVADGIPGHGNPAIRTHQVVADKSHRAVADGIPKKFHFIWSDVVIPTVFVDNLKQFRKIHPKWEINFWTLKHGRQIVGELEPQILEAYSGYGTDTARADALRYVLLYHYGGAYLDVDIHPLVPFDNLTTMGDCILGPEPMEHAYLSRNGRSFLSNAVLFCKPKHPLFRYVIDRLPKNSNAGNILGTTGPFFFTQCFNSFTSVHVRHRKYFQGLDSFSVFVCPHEYFEFKLRARAMDRMKGVCDPVVQNVEYFMTHCLSETAGPNCTAVRGRGRNERVLFDVCYEWVIHGRGLRNVSGATRYADHVHYATMFRLKSLEYTPESHITRVLPDAIIHSSTSNDNS